MTVHCPHCASTYLLPDHLLGPRGARVCCPNCGQIFVVLRDAEPIPEGEPVTVAPELDPFPPAEPVDDEGAERVAGRLLDALAEALGSRLDRARARGRVLSEHGPDLMRVWDEYRAQLGEAASASVFRQVLRERWAVDLGLGRLPEPGEERGSGESA